MRAVLLAALDAHVLGVGEAFGQVHAFAKLLETFFVELAGDLHVVNLLDAVARVGEPVGELAVVGDEDQPFARHVEPADAEDARRVGRQHVDDARPAGRVAGRADDALRFVDGEVDRLAFVKDFAVDADLLRVADRRACRAR